MHNGLTDIGAVCDMLGCTSRTLRYYEQKGIIQSTVSPYSNRRQYSPEQIMQIKEVLILRSLGVSIAIIRELQQKDRSLTEVIAERRDDLIALIEEKVKEYHLLSEVLVTLEDGGDIFSAKRMNSSALTSAQTAIVETFTDAFLQGEYDRCFAYFSENMKKQLPADAFQKTIANTLKPLGKFIEKDRIHRDSRLGNVYYSTLKYEHLGLYITVVFFKEQIHGVWLNYYHCRGEDI